MTLDSILPFKDTLLMNLYNRLQTHPNIAQMWIDTLNDSIDDTRILSQCNQALNSMCTIPDLSPLQIALIFHLLHKPTIPT